MDPRRVPGRGCRDGAVPDRWRAGDPIAGRRGRGGAPLGCRTVDRPPQPRAGERRRRRRVGVPRNLAGGHTGGRHPRHRRGAVRAACRQMAAARVGSAQRIGSRRTRRRRTTRRTPRGRPSHSVPDLRRRGPRGPGGRRHPQCSYSAESAAAGHRDRRPHRTHLPRRRTRGAAAAAAGPRAAHRRSGDAGPPPQSTHDRARRRRCRHHHCADPVGDRAEPDLRRCRRRPGRRRTRPQRADHIGVRWRWRWRWRATP